MFFPICCLTCRLRRCLGGRQSADLSFPYGFPKFTSGKKASMTAACEVKCGPPVFPLWVVIAG